MNNQNNLNTFFNDPNKNILILCDISETISEFYLAWIEKISKNRGYSIYKKLEKDGINSEGDLFGEVKIYINFTNTLNDIQKLEHSKRKVVFFTNYKNFKILKNKFLYISSYDFQKDMRELLKHINHLDSYYLKYLFNNPHIFFMELSKIEINNKLDKIIPFKEFEINEIFENRRTIFESKEDILKIYNLIKKEALIKKLNFLTY